jgi:PAS domain
MRDFNYSDFYLQDLGDADPPAVHSRFIDMIDYLKAVAPSGRLPGRRNIDPCDFASVLRLINLVDVERAEAAVQFRFRLVGGGQIHAAGRDITGQVVEDAVLPDFVGRITGNMKKVLVTQLPVFDRFPMPFPDRQFIDSQRMYYPLAADGETVDMILTLNGYDSEPLKAVG